MVLGFALNAEVVSYKPAGGRLQYRTDPADARDGPQTVLDVSEEWRELPLLVARISRVDRGQITAAGFESEVLLLPIAQALAQHRRGAYEYKRKGCLSD